MRFIKMHELGNDFVLLDGRETPDLDWSALARRICDRHTGVGAHAALILLHADAADVKMHVVNADGAEENMPGKGLLAFARYAFENGVVHKTAFSVETPSGIMRPRILLQNGRIEGVCVDMGEPVIDAAAVPVRVEGRALGIVLSADGRTFSATALRVGAPHAVVFVDHLDEADAAHYGPLIENDPLFPDRTNVDFVETVSKHQILLRTWERACGYTLSCGTGACAAAVACVLTGKTGRSVDAAVERGSLHIDWSETDNHIYMTGSAATAFSGIWKD